MSRKKLLFTLFAVSFLLPSALPAADAGTRSGERSVVQAAEGASHAGSTNLPAGWFGSKRRPAVLTATKAEPIQPAAHFDVEEPASPAAAKGQSVVDRLRKARAPQLAPRSGGNVLRSNEPNRETPPIRVEQRPVDLEVLTTSRPIRPDARSSSKEASSAVDAPAADSDNPQQWCFHAAGRQPGAPLDACRTDRPAAAGRGGDEPLGPGTWRSGAKRTYGPRFGPTARSNAAGGRGGQ